MWRLIRRYRRGVQVHFVAKSVRMLDDAARLG
jgi:hypothetical protein